MPVGINAMNLKDRLCDVRGSLNSTHFYGTRVPVEEPSTASIADTVSLLCYERGRQPRRPYSVQFEHNAVKRRRGDRHENTGNCRALRAADDSRRSRCRFPVLEKPVLGTANSEYRNCLGIRSFLLELPQASMRKATCRSPFL